MCRCFSSFSSTSTKNRKTKQKQQPTQRVSDCFQKPKVSSSMEYNCNYIAWQLTWYHWSQHDFTLTQALPRLSLFLLSNHPVNTQVIHHWTSKVNRIENVAKLVANEQSSAVHFGTHEQWMITICAWKSFWINGNKIYTRIAIRSHIIDKWIKHRFGQSSQKCIQTIYGPYWWMRVSALIS